MITNLNLYANPSVNSYIHTETVKFLMTHDDMTLGHNSLCAAAVESKNIDLIRKIVRKLHQGTSFLCAAYKYTTCYVAVY